MRYVIVCKGDIKAAHVCDSWEQVLYALKMLFRDPERIVAQVASSFSPDSPFQELHYRNTLIEIYRELPLADHWSKFRECEHKRTATRWLRDEYSCSGGLWDAKPVRYCPDCGWTVPFLDLGCRHNWTRLDNVQAECTKCGDFVALANWQDK